VIVEFVSRERHLNSVFIITMHVACFFSVTIEDIQIAREQDTTMREGN
jgi:hypothetical protein